jgi:hypothetical protein
VAVAL